jgi:hypothetical protein
MVVEASQSPSRTSILYVTVTAIAVSYHRMAKLLNGNIENDGGGVAGRCEGGISMAVVCTITGICCSVKLL